MHGARKAPFFFLRITGRALELGARTSTYIAAGFLRLEELRAAIATRWGDYSYQEVDILAGFFPWERLLYERFLKREDRILLIGCGTGRDLIALLKLGHRVEGIDASSHAISRAGEILQKEGLQAALHTGSVETIAVPGTFDAIIFGWCCYGYIPQAANRIGVLRKVRAHLNPGGRVLVSYSLAARPMSSLPITMTQFIARLTRSDWRPEPGDTFAAGSDARRIHYEHYFSPAEFEREARAAGLTVIAHDGGEQEGTAVLVA